MISVTLSEAEARHMAEALFSTQCISLDKSCERCAHLEAVRVRIERALERAEAVQA